MSTTRQFAIVTGASTGIGLELAKCCARENFDLLSAADEPEIEAAAAEVRALGAVVETVQADLATIEGVDKLYEASKRIGRPVDALLAKPSGIVVRLNLAQQNPERGAMLFEETLRRRAIQIRRFGAVNQPS